MKHRSLVTAKKKKMCKEYGEGEKHAFNQKARRGKMKLGINAKKVACTAKLSAHKEKLSFVTVLLAVLKLTSIEGKS